MNEQIDASAINIKNSPNGVTTRSMNKKQLDPVLKKDVAVQTDSTPEPDMNALDDIEFDSKEEDTEPSSEPSFDEDTHSDSGEEEEDDNEDEYEEDEYGEAQHPKPMMIVIAAPGMASRFHGCRHDDGPDDEEDDVDEEEEDADEDKQSSKKRKRNEGPTLPKHFSPDERAYFRKLPKIEQDKVLDLDKQVKQRTEHYEQIPLKFRILQSDADPATKSMVLRKIDQLQRMHQGSGEYCKLRNWLDGVSRLPLGKYNRLPVTPSDPVDTIASFLQNVRASLDKTVYGHQETKDQIMKIFAQWIANPSSKGNVIALQGAAGTGKTSLIKDGLCKALNLPFGFIALGGASDGSFLEGHSFTYEGSTYGKIAEVLQKTQVMNSVLYFDELDKISSSRRGEEVTNILIHLTDSSQNERFTDRYFSEIELNLSQSLIVFSYNDESLVNPILKDRMTVIHVKGYSKKEKLEIAKGYLLPALYNQFNLKSEDVSFTDKIIEKIIEVIPQEDGVRGLKRALESILGWINMHRFIPDPITKERVQLPLTVAVNHLDTYLKNTDFTSMISKSVLHSMYT